MTDYGRYKVHPVADLFPLMPDDAFTELVKDIADRGLMHPIVLAPDGRTIVDGRNRYLACEEARVDPTFKTLGSQFDKHEIIRFILASNIKRRHMMAGQFAMVGLSVLPLLAEAARARSLANLRRGDELPDDRISDTREAGPVNRQVAELVGVNPATVAQAKKVADTSKSLAAEVLAGTISLNDAYKQVRARPQSNERAASSKKKSTTIILRTHEGTAVKYKQPSGKATFNKTNEQVSWASWTWNPVTGCLHGCKYCYARELATRASYKPSYPVGFTPLFHHERLTAPANTRVPSEAETDPCLGRVFVCSMADLYGKWVPTEWIEQVHASCIANPQWEYLLLTKFPRRYVGMELPHTAWLGTSVDEQKRVRLAEEAFRQIKNVRVKWLSLEPLLAPLQFSDLSMFDWIVIGSQSATDQPTGHVAEFAPPFEWVARLVDQAREARCRIYLKPNLLGNVGPQSPGMQLIQEPPILRPQLVVAA